MTMWNGKEITPEVANAFSMSEARLFAKANNIVQTGNLNVLRERIVGWIKTGNTGHKQRGGARPRASVPTVQPPTYPIVSVKGVNFLDQGAQLVSGTTTIPVIVSPQTGARYAHFGGNDFVPLPTAQAQTIMAAPTIPAPTQPAPVEPPAPAPMQVRGRQPVQQLYELPAENRLPLNNRGDSKRFLGIQASKEYGLTFPVYYADANGQQHIASTHMLRFSTNYADSIRGFSKWFSQYVREALAALGDPIA